jgi:hypothetical protein
MPFQYFRRACVALLLLFPLGLGAAYGAGLAVVEKSLVLKTKDLDLSIKYPQTGNKAIDAAMLDYAKHAAGEFKGYLKDKQASDSAYTLDTTYEVERNDGKMFAVVFTEYSDTGGAHPNSDYHTFDFLLPDGAQVFLPEIVDGSRGLERLSQLTIADLIKNIGTGPDAASDKDTISMGSGPYAENFRNFVWLPDKLHLYFPAYQVASYAAGPQELFLPLVPLKDVIRPDWRAPAASFDCAKAASAIEHAICADAGLARLDRQVAENYQSKLRNAYEPGDKDKLKQVQRDWLEMRNKTCGGPSPGACLTKLYRARLDVLSKP